jgi:hypothetical protein
MTQPNTKAMEAASLLRGQVLPPTLDVVAAGALLGIGRTVAYRLVRQGQWPTHVIRVGSRIKIPTLPLLEFLGITGRDLAPIGPVSTDHDNGLDLVISR